MKPNIGLSEQARVATCDYLGKVLATSYSLQLQTQFCHWNVRGPYFDPLHQLFQRQYEELQGAVDELAERMRALGFDAPGTFNQFSEMSVIQQKSTFANSDEMVACLLDGHEALVRLCKDAIKVAGDGGDEATEDMLTERVEIHGKAAWMLRVTLEK